MGGLTTAGNLSPLIYTACYNTWFIGDGSYENQNIRGYFLFLTISIFVSHSLGIYTFGLELVSEDTPTEKSSLIKNGPLDQNEHNLSNAHGNVEVSASDVGAKVVATQGLTPVNAKVDTRSKYNTGESSDGTCKANDVPEPSSEPYSALKMVRSARFQLIMWPGMFLLALKYIVLNNLNAMLLYRQ